ncbi:MAG: tetratricopeptide repeat protein [Armatimonadota bacterium]|nr:MAG: tetratricopeptide repeat protein [Armatimonadota bacterium]
MLLVCAAGGAQEPAARSVLLFPVRSHWLSEPLAESLTVALSKELRESGFRVMLASRDAPAIRLAMSEGWVGAEHVAGRQLESARHALAVATGAGASLTAELIEGEADVRVEAMLAGAVSREVVRSQASAPAGEEPEVIARELARQVAEAVAGDLWARAGADERGRRAAAAERYAAGRAALAEGMYREAVLELETALIGEPDRPEYLWEAAQARAAGGDYKGAVLRLRRLARLRPEDAEVLLRLGNVALTAGEPERAEAAFLKAEELSREDPRAVEGVARSARARGDFERAESYYRRLLSLVGVGAPVHRSDVDAGRGTRSRRARDLPPGVGDSLPVILSHLPDDTIRLAGIPPEEVELQLARVYLRVGDMQGGLAALLRYHKGEDRRPCRDGEYLDIFPALDEESERIARGAQKIFGARGVGDLDDEEADAQMDRLHNQSDVLATLAERMEVSVRLDPAHRYRRLAYNLLNESNFEALMFLRTQDPDRQRRAEVLRSAFREARARAVQLGEALLESEGDDSSALRPPPEKVTAG